MVVTLAFLALADATLQPLNHKPLPPSSNDFWFVALGDNRPAGAGLPPTRAFRSLLEEVAVINPAFVISSGDLLYGNEETLDQYKQEVRWIKPILEALPCPFFNAPGNHEINNRPEFLKEYTESLGQLYGSFEFGGIKFVAVCTELPADKPSVFGPELDWLKSSLADKKPAVIFQHHPVFARSTNTEKENTVSGAKQLHEIYRDGGVKMVVEGHDHIYDAQTHDGVDYRIAGGAGAPLDAGPTEGGYFHFLLVHSIDGTFEATPIPAETLEVVPISDGVVAAAVYADTDLPLNNLHVASGFKPSSASATYTTKTGKATSVDCRMVSTRESAGKWDTTVQLIAPKHKATFVRLIR